MQCEDPFLLPTSWATCQELLDLLELLQEGKYYFVFQKSLRLQYDDACESALKNVCACIFSHFSPIWLLVILWAVIHQTLLSMGLSQQKYWNELPCCPPVSFPTQGWNLCLMYLLHCRRILYHWATGETLKMYISIQIWIITSKYIKLDAQLMNTIFWALSLSYTLFSFSFSFFLCCSQTVYMGLLYK